MLHDDDNDDDDAAAAALPVDIYRFTYTKWLVLQWIDVRSSELNYEIHTSRAANTEQTAFPTEWNAKKVNESFHLNHFIRTTR